MPRTATMPIPTTIHRRLDVGLSTRNLGAGNSARRVRAEGWPLRAPWAGAGTGAGTAGAGAGMRVGNRIRAEAARRMVVRGRRGGHPHGHLPDGQRVQAVFPVGSIGVHATIGLAEEKPDARGLEGVRLHHQRDLPGFREEAVVDLQIGVGQKDLAARVGVIPAHRTASPGDRSRGRTATPSAALHPAETV